MSLVQNLPLTESLGVFVGVAGIDWLADGRAEPLEALAAAVAVGTAIFVTRELMKRRRKR